MDCQVSGKASRGGHANTLRILRDGVSILRYVLNEEKTPSILYEITGYFEEEEITVPSVYDSFIENKRSWNKDSGRMYIHAIISFREDEDITPQQVREFATDFSREAYPGYRVLIVVHEDKGHLHAHLVVDTVNCMDGKSCILPDRIWTGSKRSAPDYVGSVAFA